MLTNKFRFINCCQVNWRKPKPGTCKMYKSAILDISHQGFMAVLVIKSWYRKEPSCCRGQCSQQISGWSFQPSQVNWWKPKNLTCVLRIGPLVAKLGIRSDRNLVCGLVGPCGTYIPSFRSISPAVTKRANFVICIELWPLWPYEK
jgi:hypothetical protein